MSSSHLIRSDLLTDSWPTYITPENESPARWKGASSLFRHPTTAGLFKALTTHFFSIRPVRESILRNNNRGRCLNNYPKARRKEWKKRGGGGAGRGRSGDFNQMKKKNKNQEEEPENPLKNRRKNLNRPRKPRFVIHQTPIAKN